MIDPQLRSQLAAARAAISGEYSSVSRVVDTLLDLRSAAEDDSDLQVELDHILSDIPGLTVTANEWWAAQLDAIEILARRTSRGEREAVTG